jgi:hypothetical protein
MDSAVEGVAYIAFDDDKPSSPLGALEVTQVSADKVIQYAYFCCSCIQ